MGFATIKVNVNPIQSPLDLLQSQLPPEQLKVPEAYYPWNHVKEQGRQTRAKKTNIRHSVYKLALVARLLNKKHLYDAQSILNHLPKKAADIIKKTLNSARANAVQQGMQEERLFVKSIICGKGCLYKKLLIQGRGRMGIMRVPKSSIKIELEEKPLNDWYKLML
jgi:large subunit ribosomal protein L22